MAFRFLGMLAIMVGSTGLGLYYGARETFRLRELLEFKKALLILASEIEYMGTPLASACGNIVQRTEGVVQALFQNFAQRLEASDSETAYQLWTQSLGAIKEKSYMAKEDIVVIDGFGKTLGYLDKELQQNAIAHTIGYIKEKAATLQAAGDKNKRMYRSLGVIGGLLITIVLW